jgi:hypothetical protein
MRPKITDDELITAVEEATEEHGSKIDAIRHAIRQTLGDGDGDTSGDRINSHLRPELRKAHRTLWETSHAGKANMDAALAALAQQMSVDKNLCKVLYIRPLANEEMVRVDPGMAAVTLWVRDPDQTIDRDEITDDELDQIDDELDELAESGEEAAEADV